MTTVGFRSRKEWEQASMETRFSHFNSLFIFWYGHRQFEVTEKMLNEAWGV